jgi:AraC-like DNA-binding protein
LSPNPGNGFWPRPPGTFGEAPAWREIGEGWRPLFGSYRELGFSFEWHDFTAKQTLDWAASFHPGSLELCFNVEGTGRIEHGSMTTEVPTGAFTFYAHSQPPLRATRNAGKRHRFLTVEYSPNFLRQQFAGYEGVLDPRVRSLLAEGEPPPSFAQSPERLTTSMLQLMESLKQCPVLKDAQGIWFRCKAVEIATHIFLRPAQGEMFCTRAQRAARDRVEKAREVLRQRLAEPLSLDDLAKRVGCSPYYLSRQFSQETGMTIQQYVRELRMERAAELLRSGRYNVTEAALEVGYNSLSHFSSLFHETFGCCPGLYPLKTPAQSEFKPQRE